MRIFRRSVGLSNVSATQLHIVRLVSELPVRNRSLVGFLGLRAFQIDRTRVVVWSPPATVVLPVTTSRRLRFFHMLARFGLRLVRIAGAARRLAR